MIRGHFIVLEGIDGSGTTTQAERLRGRFDNAGLPVHVTAEPSTGPIGSTIRQFLSGRLVTRLPSGITNPRWTTMALMFAADRQDHLEAEIEPNLRDGVNIICDRYMYSSIVYQSVTAGRADTAGWIAEINRYARKPDLAIYLRIDPEEAMRRCRERDRNVELFDDPEVQRKIAEAYDKLPDLFPEVKIVTVDGGCSVDEVEENCWSHVEALRAEGAPE